MGEIHVAFKIKALIIVFKQSTYYSGDFDNWQLCLVQHWIFFFAKKGFWSKLSFCRLKQCNTNTAEIETLPQLVCKNAKTDITDDIRENSLHLIMLLMY